MGFVTPPIHFGRLILCVRSSPFLVSLLRPFSGYLCDVYLGCTNVPCVSPNASLLIRYVVYIISLKTLDLPSGEGASTLTISDTYKGSYFSQDTSRTLLLTESTIKEYNATASRQQFYFDLV